VAVDVLGHGVDNNVRAVLQGILNIRGKESVVDDHLEAVAVRRFRDLFNIDEA